MKLELCLYDGQISRISSDEEVEIIVRDYDWGKIVEENGDEDDTPLKHNETDNAPYVEMKL